MKIFLYSHSPSALSGYGQQVNQLANRLEYVYDHDVNVIAIDYHNAPTEINGIMTYPTIAGLTRSPTSLYYWAERLQPDLIIQLFDAWTLGKSWIKEGIPVICYNPVDCYPLARRHELGQLGSVAQLAMSRHAEACFFEAGFTNPIYLPHCYSGENYYNASKSANRKQLGIPDDIFLVGLIGTNITHRKNIPGQLLAFSEFAKIHDNARLLLQTEPNETISTSFDIYHYMKTLGLEGKVYLRNPSSNRHKDIDDASMFTFYNSLDVLLHASLGEGFGVSIIEAQACGVPVIVSNCSAMPQIVGDGGIVVKEGIKVADSGTMSWWFQPSHEAVCDSLCELKMNSNLYEDLHFKAIANANKYEWDKWLHVWERLIQEYSL